MKVDGVRQRCECEEGGGVELGVRITGDLFRLAKCVKWSPALRARTRGQLRAVVNTRCQACKREASRRASPQRWAARSRQACGDQVATFTTWRYDRL